MSKKSETKPVDRLRYIKTAALIAFWGNLLLAVLKLFTGIKTGSLSVFGDGIDSATDVLVAGIALFISYLISRPSDKTHPWGHGRAETTATMAFSFIIFFAGLQLVFSAVKSLLNKTAAPETELLSVIIILVSIAGKLGLALSQYFLGKKADSSITLANAQNMRNDVVISVSVLLGLCLSYFFTLPLIDSIIALLVGLWVIRNAVKLFLEMNMELMDGSESSEEYKTLFSVIKGVDGVSNPHKVRMRKIASMWDIDLDIEVDENMTVHEAHKIADKLEEEIKKAIPEVYDIVIHVEPAGHRRHHRREQYGLKETDIDD
ncbi:MAG: cation transporter [Spirochaetaceae bacterium]|jgi:cation diffusion facilitator family transporter|nr:cation transporter [Spirochaetaceae bacterium]